MSIFLSHLTSFRVVEIKVEIIAKLGWAQETSLQDYSRHIGKNISLKGLCENNVWVGSGDRWTRQCLPIGNWSNREWWRIHRQLEIHRYWPRLPFPSQKNEQIDTHWDLSSFHKKRAFCLWQMAQNRNWLGREAESQKGQGTDNHDSFRICSKLWHQLKKKWIDYFWIITPIEWILPLGENQAQKRRENARKKSRWQ